ncbi:MAG: SpoIIE family protein phosphatase [Acidobacteriota bacterium]|nr:SpoIIE family protein phosphatase [Acidobacteriota bacterium]
MKLRKRTRVWLILFAAGCAAGVLGSLGQSGPGCIGGIGIAVAVCSAAVLATFAIVAAFRAIVRRLTLRLAFSYFLIGLVPIPLVGALLFFCGYLVAHQIVATRVRREVVALGREAEASGEPLPALRTDRSGRVVASDLPWIPVGSSAPWARTLDAPRPLIEGERAWLAVASSRPSRDRIALILLTDPEHTWARKISARTGYHVAVQVGTSRRRGGLNIDVSEHPEARKPAPPLPAAKSPRGWLDKEWIAGVYIDTPAATFGTQEEGGRRNIVLYVARTSPRVLFDQLFEQGLPEVGKVFWAVFLGLAGALLLVYFTALAIAFVLVATIARNVNRLTRASKAISGGDFSVRVNSRSRDQIGDLARSFDGMAASIQGLLVETAQKERLEGEIAIARTLQQKLLPAPGAKLPGLSLLARFEPLAEIGGDYYDYARLADGASAVAIGDVSGHGLATGLLVAMAKAGLWTLLESGLEGTPLFLKLNELIHRSTDSRNYMTLALFAYDPATCVGTLTNAGQLAPYRIGPQGVESLSLPSFPLGVSLRSDFPTRSWQFSRGERLVFVTDGIIEAASPSGDPFGYDRLEALLREQAASEPARIQEAILSAVAAHSGGAPPEDDRTLVVVALD